MGQARFDHVRSRHLDAGRHDPISQGPPTIPCHPNTGFQGLNGPSPQRGILGPRRGTARQKGCVPNSSFLPVAPRCDGFRICLPRRAKAPWYGRCGPIGSESCCRRAPSIGSSRPAFARYRRSGRIGGSAPPPAASV
ncbi:protein of unassigned function [Methylobacterium oryzae CBMB20]|uniref:Protein of unassigned function n=1 Tax=Methylobacterium oryzae CBMB20 TaxID=693986 RepID=A0A089NL35_9HYPH|nr:protein of unassigned function [Methylobacterium oryzae CBMB20]